MLLSFFLIAITKEAYVFKETSKMVQNELIQHILDVSQKYFVKEIMKAAFYLWKRKRS